MGAMQVLVHEKLWRRQRYLSWRTQFEYLIGALWWLEGLATILALAIPAVLLVTGAATSTVAPQTFLPVFLVAFSLRMWGYKLLLRRQIRWRTAFALRVLRVPVGLACLWWLVSRRTLLFKVTPKGASHLRSRGRIPGVVLLLVVCALGLVTYAVLGTRHLVPWRTDASSTATSGVWILAGLVVLAHAVRRIRAEQYATTRRSAHRFATGGEVRVDGVAGELVDVSVNGAAVRFAPGAGVLPGPAEVSLPGTSPMHMLASSPSSDGLVKLSLPAGDWAALRTLSLWLFHTPAGAVQGLPDGVPVVAVTAA
jgi:cellulose synthase (UDP-forming)